MKMRGNHVAGDDGGDARGRRCTARCSTHFSFRHNIQGSQLLGFIATSWLLTRIAAITVLAHLFEIDLGRFYYWKEALPSLETASISAPSPATIGYGDIVLPLLESARLWKDSPESSCADGRAPSSSRQSTGSTWFVTRARQTKPSGRAAVLQALDRTGHARRRRECFTKGELRRTAVSAQMFEPRYRFGDVGSCLRNPPQREGPRPCA
jgi:hypothetical protein